MSRTKRALAKMSGAGCGAFVCGMVLLFVLLSAAWAEEFPLKVRPLTQEEMGSVDGVSAALSEERPTGISAEPKYKGVLPPRYAQVALGGGSLTLVFDCGDAKAKSYDLLYVDRDGDGDLAEEAPVGVAAREAVFLTSFQPVTVDVPFAGGKRPGLVQVRALVFGEDLMQVTVAPASCLEATVRLGTQEYRVALVDADLSGVLGDGEGSLSADRLLIDLNGNRVYDRRGQYPIPAAQEGRPLSECWQVGQNWWSATVAGDWSAVTVKPAEVTYGELRYRGPQPQSLVLVSRRYGYVLPSFKEGVARVPVGEHTVDGMQLAAKDAQGRAWELSASGDETRLIKVATDAPAEIDLSQPMVGTVEAETGEGDVRFSLALALAGQEVSSVTVGDGRPPEPTFTIKDSAGKEVATGKFEYG